MPIKTATITFHASHNYGSMLQAYALQQVLFRLGYDNEIINLRTECQRQVYKYPETFDYKGIKAFLKSILYIPYVKNLQKKYALFEQFLESSLVLTREYKSLEELQETGFDYDCYISGGDQIWNTTPKDFDWSFYLPFVQKGKRISYAVSMGPKAEEQVFNRDRIREYLLKYNSISVREEGTASLISILIDKQVGLTLDPALLLTSEEWSKNFSQKPIVEGDYIFLYVPYFMRSVYEMSEYLSKRLKMKVVVSLLGGYKSLLYSFDKCLAVGPWEFLNLLKHAKLVVSGSFHALVFSVLFHVPFFAVNGDKDNRMITFLKNLHLLDRTINTEDRTHKWENSFQCDFAYADLFLSQQRLDSFQYLKESIEG